MNPQSEYAIASQTHLEIPAMNIPSIVSKAFKSPRKHQIYLDGINTLKKEGHLNFMSYQKTEDEVKSLPTTFMRDFQTASKAINPTHQGKKIDLNQMKKRIALINPSITEKDILRIGDNAHQITAENYFELCKEYAEDLEGHDPITAAFQFLVDESGEIDFEKVNKYFEAFGYEELQKRDIEIIHEHMDLKREGKVSLDDFKRVFKFLGR